jgi:predicted hotdog family 3-hydroxylacyl-ACP dehydratase
MTDGAFPAMGDLLPHGRGAMLLDRVKAKHAEGIEVSVSIGAGSPFLVPGNGVPAHVGLEYMAQACGAFAGLEALAHGKPVRVGYLLGTRRYRATAAWFAEGDSLDVAAHLVLPAAAMTVFECRIAARGVTLATAQLTVYQP